jgi:hypothetical protein
MRSREPGGLCRQKSPGEGRRIADMRLDRDKTGLDKNRLEQKKPDLRPASMLFR